SSAGPVTTTSTPTPSRTRRSHWRAQRIERCPLGSEGGCAEKARIHTGNGTSPRSPPCHLVGCFDDSVSTTLGRLAWPRCFPCFDICELWVCGPRSRPAKIVKLSGVANCD